MEAILIFMISTVSLAKLFGDRAGVFSYHDILAKEEQGRKYWFLMEDYHVFPLASLTD